MTTQRDYRKLAITEGSTVTLTDHSQEEWETASKLHYLVEWMRHTPGLRTELSLDGTYQHNLTIWEEFVRTHPDKRDWGSFAIVELD